MSPNDVLKLQKLYDCSKTTFYPKKMTPNHTLLFVAHIVTTCVFVFSAPRVTFLESCSLEDETVCDMTFSAAGNTSWNISRRAQKLGRPPTTMAWVHKGVEQVNLHEKTSLHYELYIYIYILIFEFKLDMQSVIFNVMFSCQNRILSA